MEWLKKFLENNSKQAHSFGAFFISLGVLYATNLEVQGYVNVALAQYPGLVALLGLAVVVYRNYASPRNRNARQRATDQPGRSGNNSTTSQAVRDGGQKELDP